MATEVALGFSSWQRVIDAVRQVKERLLRATSVLNRAEIPYAVVGGNAVGVWVARLDEGGVRNTPDVNILLRRTDLLAAIAVLETAGFFHRQTPNDHLFLDGPEGSPRAAVHVHMANELLRENDLIPSPDVSESEVGENFRLLSLEALVRMKLTSYRLKDQVHLQDLLEVGLIDATWLGRFTPEFAERLQRILDNPHT